MSITSKNLFEQIGKGNIIDSIYKMKYCIQSKLIVSKIDMKPGNILRFIYLLQSNIIFGY